MPSLTERLTDLETQRRDALQLRERALRAVEAANVDVIRVEAQLALVRELLQEESNAPEPV